MWRLWYQRIRVCGLSLWVLWFSYSLSFSTLFNPQLFPPQCLNRLLVHIGTVCLSDKLIQHFSKEPLWWFHAWNHPTGEGICWYVMLAEITAGKVKNLWTYGSEDVSLHPCLGGTSLIGGSQVYFTHVLLSFVPLFLWSSCEWSRVPTLPYGCHNSSGLNWFSLPC